MEAGFAETRKADSHALALAFDHRFFLSYDFRP
jgi:hypothetical protein